MPGALAIIPESENIPEYRGKINLAEAFKLKFKHKYTFQQLADRYGVVPSAVHGALKNFLNLLHSPEQSMLYEEKRAEILNAVEFRIVTQMVNKKKLKAASLNNLAYAASQINNMLRLEKGQPTSITEQLDADLNGLIDQLCGGMKSAGSGSTIDVDSSSSPAEAPAAPINVLECLEEPKQPIQSIEPLAELSTTGKLEGTIPPVQPVKPAKRTKSAKQTTSKSATKSRKQASSNITTDLNSKIAATKEGANSISPVNNHPAQEKEWYE